MYPYAHPPHPTASPPTPPNSISVPIHPIHHHPHPHPPHQTTSPSNPIQPHPPHQPQPLPDGIQLPLLRWGCCVMRTAFGGFSFLIIPLFLLLQATASKQRANTCWVGSLLAGPDVRLGGALTAQRASGAIGTAQHSTADLQSPLTQLHSTPCPGAWTPLRTTSEPM